MKKKVITKLVLIFGITLIPMMLCEGCASESLRVSNNISKEADNFNIVRQISVINCITGEMLFQMTGKMSITADASDNQLEIIVEGEDPDNTGKKKYQKHFIGLSDNVTYIVEDLNLGNNAVKNYKYTLNFNPKMTIPFDVKTY